MSPVHFKKLSLSAQSALLWQEGTHLCSKETSLYLVHLYAMRNFYVEVSFSYELCRVEKIRVISKTHELEQYLQDIHLPGGIF